MQHLYAWQQQTTISMESFDNKTSAHEFVHGIDQDTRTLRYESTNIRHTLTPNMLILKMIKCWFAHFCVIGSDGVGMADFPSSVFAEEFALMEMRNWTSREPTASEFTMYVHGLRISDCICLHIAQIRRQMDTKPRIVYNITRKGDRRVWWKIGESKTTRNALWLDVW